MAGAVAPAFVVPGLWKREACLTAEVLRDPGRNPMSQGQLRLRRFFRPFTLQSDHASQPVEVAVRGRLAMP